MLTTVCPSCHTEFRVSWEQLKVRAGRVRCGQCHTVFNGLTTLNRHGEEEPREPEGIAPPAPIAAIPSSAPEVIPQTPEPETAISWPQIKFGDDLPDDSAANPDQDDPSLQAAIGQSAPSMPLPVASASTPAVPVAAPVASSQANPPVFDFGPRAAAKSGWWWIPSAIFLLLVLLGQTLYYFRGAIALLLPEAKPYINELCQELGCEVPLPRRAELVSIETSDLQADPTNPGVMVLIATLRNRAAFPQAFPALELTLTNDRDLPLARRVLQAGDYLADKAEAFDGSSEKQIRLYVEAGALQASGYRLYLFYP